MSDERQARVYRRIALAAIEWAKLKIMAECQSNDASPIAGETRDREGIALEILETVVCHDMGEAWVRYVYGLVEREALHG